MMFCSCRYLSPSINSCMLIVPSTTHFVVFINHGGMCCPVRFISCNSCASEIDSGEYPPHSFTDVIGSGLVMVALEERVKLVTGAVLFDGLPSLLVTLTSVEGATVLAGAAMFCEPFTCNASKISISDEPSNWFHDLK